MDKREGSESVNTNGKNTLKLVKKSEDIVSRSCENLQTFVWWGANLYPPPPLPLHKNVCDIEELVLIFYESTSNMTIVLIF